MRWGSQFTWELPVFIIVLFFWCWCFIVSNDASTCIFFQFSICQSDIFAVHIDTRPQSSIFRIIPKQLPRNHHCLLPQDPSDPLFRSIFGSLSTNRPANLPLGSTPTAHFAPSSAVSIQKSYRTPSAHSYLFSFAPLPRNSLKQNGPLSSRFNCISVTSKPSMRAGSETRMVCQHGKLSS